MEYEGYNGQIIVDEDADTLTITRNGMAARVTFPKGEPRVIPLKAISEVRYSDATVMKNGHLALGLNGESVPNLKGGDAVADIDTVLFRRKHRKEFEQLHNWLLKVVRDNQALGIDPSAYKPTGGSISRAAQSEAKSEQLEAKVDRMNAELEQKKAEDAMRSAGRTEAGDDEDPVLFRGQSHESGRNAVVTLYSDRIERVKEKAYSAVGRAKQDVEMTPLRSISSVQTSKDGVRRTRVTVYAVGNNIEFRFEHKEAAKFKDAIQKLLLAKDSNAPASAVPAQTRVQEPAAADVADQLTKLADLRDRGVLSDEEFANQKSKLLNP